MSRPGRAAVGLAVSAGAWVVLAAIRPDTTYHLAPAVVVWTYPYLRLRGDTVPLRQVAGAVAVSTASAISVTAVLDRLDLLQGPVLFGGDAAGEALLVVAIAAVVALAVAAVRTTSR